MGKKNRSKDTHGTKGKGSHKDKGPEQRQHPRVALDVLVQVKSESIEEFRAVHAKNISVGGMFIASTAARPMGAQVYFQFTVKDGGTLIEGLGKVVHSSATGMGVEFVSVLEPSLSIIRVLVEQRMATAPSQV